MHCWGVLLCVTDTTFDLLHSLYFSALCETETLFILGVLRKTLNVLGAIKPKEATERICSGLFSYCQSRVLYNFEKYNSTGYYDTMSNYDEFSQKQHFQNTRKVMKTEKLWIEF